MSAVSLQSSIALGPVAPAKPAPVLAGHYPACLVNQRGPQARVRGRGVSSDVFSGVLSGIFNKLHKMISAHTLTGVIKAGEQEEAGQWD